MAARSLLKVADIIAESVSNISISNTRRGYSAAAVAVSSKPKPSTAAKGRREDATADSKSWVPDPVTGYYRPANRPADVDAAELRRVLLSQKFSQNSN